MIKLTFHAALLVFSLASVVIATDSELHLDRASNETKHSKSVENANSTLQGISKLTDSAKLGSLFDEGTVEMQHSQSVQNVSDKMTAKPIGMSINRLALEDEVTTEMNELKPVNSDNVTIHAIGVSTQLPSLKVGAADEMVGSESIENNNTNQQPIGKVMQSNTLLTLQEKSPQNTTRSSSNDTKSNDNLGWRRPEKNNTNDEKYWNIWSGSSQLVPRTGLLAVATVVCVLACKATWDLGTE